MIAGAIFDLDGVVTFTARVHAGAWKELFDGYLRARASRYGEPFRPFTDDEYHRYVDGLPRNEGIRAFLASRAIELQEGDASDEPGSETVAGLGNRKNELFRARLRADGVEVDALAVRLIRGLRTRGTRVGIATSSKNAAAVLKSAGLEELFQARVDGMVSERLGLRGKPAPDIFLECLRRLGVADPAEAMIVEDAEAGVEAGRAGGFGLVLGVDRGGHADALSRRGADVVLEGFEGVTPDRLETLFDSSRAGAAHDRTSGQRSDDGAGT